MRRNSWCTCEDTRDDFGSCMPIKNNKICFACKKRISKRTLLQLRARRIK